jgi:hypothetical protein
MFSPLSSEQTFKLAPKLTSHLQKFATEKLEGFAF